MKNLENEGSILPHIVDKLRTNGLPSVDAMRADVEDVRNKKFQSDIAQKLVEYKELFEKFTNQTATSEELKRMTELSAELLTLDKSLNS